MFGKPITNSEPIDNDMLSRTVCVMLFQYRRLNPWDRSIMYYAVNPFEEVVLFPTYVDVKITEKIYGKDGFGGHIPAYTPRTHWYTMGDEDLCSWKCQKAFQ